MTKRTADYQRERINNGHWRIHRGSQVFGEVKKVGPSCWVATPKGHNGDPDMGTHTAMTLDSAATWLANRASHEPAPQPSGKYMSQSWNGESFGKGLKT